MPDEVSFGLHERIVTRGLAEALRGHFVDLLIAETALHHAVGVLHMDRGYGRIAEVRPKLTQRSL